LKKNPWVQKEGMVLVSVIVFILILSVIGLAFLNLARTERVSAHRECHLSQAFYLAEAGVEHAIANLLDGDENNISATALGSGTYEVTITGSNPYTLRSTGRFGTPEISKVIETVVQTATSSVFTHAVFGDEGVWLSGNAETDSYDSRKGEYEEIVDDVENVGSNGDLGTNDTRIAEPYAIHLENNVDINGSVEIGPGGNTDDAVLIENNAEIIAPGTATSASSLKELPPITAPGELVDRGAYSLDGNDDDTISLSGQYSSFSLDSNADVTIDGNVTIYVTGALSLNSNSNIFITEGSEVTIYIGGAFHQDSNSGINNLAQDPTKLMVYGLDTCTSVTWDSNSDFYGGFYAPGADIVLDSNADIYGSIVGDTVDLASNSSVHYDEALINCGPATGDADLDIVSWAEEGAHW